MAVNAGIGTMDTNPESFHVSVTQLRQLGTTAAQRQKVQTIAEKRAKVVKQYGQVTQQNERTSLQAQRQRNDQIRLPELHGQKPHQMGIVFGPPPETPKTMTQKQKTQSSKMKAVGGASLRLASRMASVLSTEQGGVGKSMLGHKQSLEHINAVNEQYSDEYSDDGGSGSIDTANLDPMQRLVKQERKWKAKYMITEDAQQVIDRMDEIIRKKHDVEFETIKNQLSKMLQKIIKGERHDSTILDYSELVDACKEFDTSRKHRPEEIEEFEHTAAKQLYKKRQQEAKSAYLSESTTAEALKTLPPIVVELMQEFQTLKGDGRFSGGASRAKSKARCDCQIRQHVKEFIRYLRDHDHNLHKSKARLKKSEHRICAHSMGDDLDEEQNLIMMTAFEHFAQEFENVQAKGKVKKPAIFKRFCEILLKEESLIPVFQELKAYIKENKLLRADVDYSDFARYNKFLALKEKKVVKLKGDELQKLDIEESGDSSVEGSDWEKEREEPKIQIYQAAMRDDSYQPRQKDLVKGEDAKNIELNLVMAKDIKINSNMYQNFLGVLLESEEPGAGSALPGYRSDVEIQASMPEKLQISKDQFEKCILTSLRWTLLQLSKINKHLQEVALAQKRNQYRSSQHVVIRRADRDVDCVKNALEAALPDAMVDYEQRIRNAEAAIRRRQNEKLRQKEEEAQRHLLLANTRGKPAALAGLVPDEVKRKDDEDLGGARADQSTQQDGAASMSKQNSSANSLVLFEKEFAKWRFYQKAKRLVGHPADKCLTQNPLMMKFFVICERRNLLAQPLFIEIIKDQSIIIKDRQLSLAQVQGLHEVLQEGVKLGLEEFRIKSLYIDDSAMDDEKLLLLLNVLKDQECLESIVLMNCYIKKRETATILSSFLSKRVNINKPRPVLKEFRLVNVQGSGNEQFVLSSYEYPQCTRKACIKKREKEEKERRIAKKQAASNGRNIYTHTYYQDSGNPYDTYEQPSKGCTCDSAGRTKGLKIYLPEPEREGVSEQLGLMADVHQPLQRLQLSRVHFERSSGGVASPLIEHLCDLIRKDGPLHELDLSYASIGLEDLGYLTKALTENVCCRTLSLKGISCLTYLHGESSHPPNWPNGLHGRAEAVAGTQLHAARTPTSKMQMRQQVLKNLAEFISSTQQLQHLDLSGMCLGDDILALADAFRVSENLVSIHLGDNNISQTTLKKLFVHLAIDYNQVGSRIWCKSNATTLFSVDAELTRTDFAAPGQRPTQHVSASKAEPAAVIKCLYQQLNRANNKDLRELQHLKAQSCRDATNLTDKQEPASQLFIGNATQQLILTRKLGKPELIYSEKPAAKGARGVKHLDLANALQKWQVKVADEECYVCQKHQFVRLFFRACSPGQFIKVNDDRRAQQLRSRYQIDKHSQPADPFGHLPLLMGSILGSGVPSVHMISAKHQSALLWASTCSKKQKTAAGAAKVMKELRQGTLKLAKANFEKLDQGDVERMNQALSTWRDQIFEGGKELGTTFINRPVQDPGYPEEDDIFAFSGYVKPGRHSLLIFDPSSDSFFEMSNLIIEQRSEAIPSKKEAFPVAAAAFYESSANFKAVQSAVYGALLNDPSYQTAEEAFSLDVDQRFLDLCGGSQLLIASIRSHYRIILKLWRLLEAKYYSGQTHTVQFSMTQLAGLIPEIVGTGSGAWTGARLQVDKLLQEFSSIVASSPASKPAQVSSEPEVAEAGATPGASEGQPSSETQGQPTTPQNDSELSRQILLLCLIQTAKILAERTTQPSETLEKSFEHLVGLIVGFLEHEDSDLQNQRRRVVFSNKQLTLFLWDSADTLRGLFKSHHLLDVDAKSKTHAFTFSKSLVALQKHFLPDIELSNLYRIARQSQVTSTWPWLDSSPRLTIEEFSLFLVNVALYRDRKRSGEEPDDLVLAAAAEQVSPKLALDFARMVANFITSLVVKAGAPIITEKYIGPYSTLAAYTAPSTAGQAEEGAQPDLEEEVAAVAEELKQQSGSKDDLLMASEPSENSKTMPKRGELRKSRKQASESGDESLSYGY